MEKKIEEHFKSAASSLHKAVDFGLRVSLELNGKPATDQTQLASIVHTKMSVNGASVEHMLAAPLTDHSVVLCLCRMIMEASVLYQYLIESVDNDEWECRLLCLRLHELTNRMKLMSAFKDAEEKAEYHEGRDNLLRLLRENSFFKTLPSDRAERILTGEHFYLHGVHNAAKKSAGWDSRKYMSLYAYFSSHAHSAPMSFFRFRQHKIRFVDPSDVQLSAMVTAMSVAEYSLLKASLLHLNTTPQCVMKFDSGELLEMQRVLTSWKGHFES